MGNHGKITIAASKKFVDSTDIDHVFTYHAPVGNQPERYQKIRDSAKALATTLLECCPDCSDRDAAIQKLRMCVMIANASIACYDY